MNKKMSNFFGAKASNKRLLLSILSVVFLLASKGHGALAVPDSELKSALSKLAAKTKLSPIKFPSSVGQMKTTSDFKSGPDNAVVRNALARLAAKNRLPLMKGKATRPRGENLGKAPALNFGLSEMGLADLMGTSSVVGEDFDQYKVDVGSFNREVTKFLVDVLGHLVAFNDKNYSKSSLTKFVTKKSFDILMLLEREYSDFLYKRLKPADIVQQYIKVLVNAKNGKAALPNLTDGYRQALVSVFTDNVKAIEDMRDLPGLARLVQEFLNQSDYNLVEDGFTVGEINEACIKVKKVLDELEILKTKPEQYDMTISVLSDYIVKFCLENTDLDAYAFKYENLFSWLSSCGEFCDLVSDFLKNKPEAKNEVIEQLSERFSYEQVPMQLLVSLYNTLNQKLSTVVNRVGSSVVSAPAELEKFVQDAMKEEAVVDYDQRSLMDIAKCFKIAQTGLWFDKFSAAAVSNTLRDKIYDKLKTKSLNLFFNQITAVTYNNGTGNYVGAGTRFGNNASFRTIFDYFAKIRNGGRQVTTHHGVKNTLMAHALVNDAPNSFHSVRKTGDDPTAVANYAQAAAASPVAEHEVEDCTFDLVSAFAGDISDVSEPNIAATFKNKCLGMLDNCEKLTDPALGIAGNVSDGTFLAKLRKAAPFLADLAATMGKYDKAKNDVTAAEPWAKAFFNRIMTASAEELEFVFYKPAEAMANLLRLNFTENTTDLPVGVYTAVSSVPLAPGGGLVLSTKMADLAAVTANIADSKGLSAVYTQTLKVRYENFIEAIGKLRELFADFVGYFSEDAFYTAFSSEVKKIAYPASDAELETRITYLNDAGAGSFKESLGNFKTDIFNAVDNVDALKFFSNDLRYFPSKPGTNTLSRLFSGGITGDEDTLLSRFILSGGGDTNESFLTGNAVNAAVPKLANDTPYKFFQLMSVLGKGLPCSYSDSTFSEDVVAQAAKVFKQYSNEGESLIKSFADYDDIKKLLDARKNKRFRDGKNTAHGLLDYYKTNSLYSKWNATSKLNSGYFANVFEMKQRDEWQSVFDNLQLTSESRQNVFSRRNIARSAARKKAIKRLQDECALIQREIVEMAGRFKNLRNNLNSKRAENDRKSEEFREKLSQRNQRIKKALDKCKYVDHYGGSGVRLSDLGKSGSSRPTSKRRGSGVRLSDLGKSGSSRPTSKRRSSGVRLSDL